MNKGFSTIVVLGFSLIITSCATKHARSVSSETVATSDGNYYSEAAYNDKNRAPEKYSPPPVLSDSDKLNPFYLRTQADYHYSLGEAYSLEGQPVKAIEAFTTVLVYDTKSPSVRIRLAKEYLKLGQINKSVDQVKIVIEENPANKDARLLLAGLYTSARNYPLAIEQYEKLIAENPKFYEGIIYLAAVYSETQNYDKSIKLFERVLDAPEYANKHLIYYYLGRIKEEQDPVKNSVAIESAYRKSIEVKSDFADAVLALGGYFKIKKQEDKALDLYKKFQSSKGPNVKIAEVLSQMYIDRQKFDEAFEQLEILESQSDDPLAVKVRMALILIEKKMFEPAISKLEDILRLAPDSDKIRFYLAAVYEEVKKDDLAIGHYLKIPATSSFFSESIVHAGYLMKNSGDLARAVSTLETAYEIKKDSPQIIAMYASLLDENRDYDKALSILKLGVEKFPDNPQLYFYYGSIFDRIGKKELVVENMKKVIELDPNHAQGLNYLAFTWAEMGENLEDAEKMARRAVSLDPEDGYILDTLGWILYKKGTKKEALKYLEAAHKFQPRVGIIAEHLGDVYRDLALNEKAKTMYRKAFEVEIDKQKIKQLEEKILAIDKQLIPDRVPASK